MSVEQLNELIYRLSAEGRLRYDTERALAASGVAKRAKPDDTQRELEKARANIDAKASLSFSKPDLARG
jgi:hypothetical protein